MGSIIDKTGYRSERNHLQNQQSGRHYYAERSSEPSPRSGCKTSRPSRLKAAPTGSIELFQGGTESSDSVVDKIHSYRAVPDLICGVASELTRHLYGASQPSDSAAFRAKPCPGAMHSDRCFT